MANEILQYSKSLDYKMDLFINKLVSEGIRVIDERFSEALGADNTDHHTIVRISSFDKVRHATLEVEGNQLLFIEFGAGIHYNTPADTSPHPLGEQFGFTIGNYSDLYLGKLDKWTYINELGNVVETHGTKATMPMYSANKYWIDNCIRIAKEVFQ